MVKKCPAFFKYYVAEQNVGKMKIPVMFVRSIQENLPENVVLRDRYNNSWQMKVKKEGDFWYIKDGWTKFVNDNMIESMYILLYEYFSEGLFYFKIFGPSACETKGVGGPQHKNTEEHFEIIELDGDNEDDTVEEHNEMIESNDNDVDDTEYYNYVPTTREENERNDCTRGRQARSGGASASSRRNKRDTNRDWYGADIFGSGLVPQPRNPYFVTTRRRNRETELYIPMDVTKGYNLELPETITLIDPRGRMFQAMRNVWNDGRMFYVGGWKILCRLNLVEIDDKCICEFVRGDDGNLNLSVSFFRPNRQQQGRGDETK